MARQGHQGRKKWMGEWMGVWYWDYGKLSDKSRSTNVVRRMKVGQYQEDQMSWCVEFICEVWERYMELNVICSRKQHFSQGQK